MMGENMYEVVDQFCYLGDMISAGGGAEASLVSQVRSGWKKFRELLPLLTSRVFSLKMKGQLYAACVRSAMVYGSETWAVKEDDMHRIDHAEMYMVCWMCNVKLKDRKSSSELQSCLGLESVREIMQHGRLQWFGHVEQMENHELVKRIRDLDVEDTEEEVDPERHGIRLSVLICMTKVWRELLPKIMLCGRLPSVNPV